MSDAASPRVVVGKAEVDAEPFRGWLVGHFVPPELGPRSTAAVEVKWGMHRLGETRPEWGASPVATSLSLLVRGAIRLYFANGEEALLESPGDYALWPPDVSHRWRIERDDTVVLTVRWPSE